MRLLRINIIIIILLLEVIEINNLTVGDKDFVYVPDMMCDNCVDHVTKGLKKYGL